LPTLARLAGADLPRDRPIDGRDISPLLTDPARAQSPHDALCFYWGQDLQAVRSGRWKLHFPHSFRSLSGEPGADGKPGPYADRKIELSLFDLETDASETTNVAEKHSEVVERLKQLAERARHDLGDSATKRDGTGVRTPGKI
jgi:hypothetical protein